MAKKSTLPNRSQFIRQQFTENPDVSAKAIIAAWEAAGGTEKIAPSLVYMVKTTLGRKSARPAKRGRPAAAPTASRPTRSEPVAPPTNAYEVIEASLDEMLHASAGLRDSRLAELLRAARRGVSSRLLT